MSIQKSAQIVKKCITYIMLYFNNKYFYESTCKNEKGIFEVIFKVDTGRASFSIIIKILIRNILRLNYVEMTYIFIIYYFSLFFVFLWFIYVVSPFFLYC